MAGRIMTKIDWFTAVFNDCTLTDVFSHFPNIETRLTKTWSELWSERFLRSKGYSYDVILNVGGATCQFKYDDVLSNTECDDFDFLTAVFKYIRFELSGAALDEFRAYGYDVDELLFKEWTLPQGSTYHVTRCDFAFDLLDHCTNFLDVCFDWVHLNHTASGRIQLATAKQGIAYEEKHGDSECLIIGGHSADKKLRIYDKGFQASQKRCVDPYTGMWSERWIRIELQLRREHAHGVLYAESERGFMPVLRYIYDNYAFRASSRWNDLSNVWNELFDWKTIPSIIQNANSVLYVPVIDRATRWIKNTAFGSLFIYAAYYGYEELIKLIDQQARQLARSTFQTDFRRFNALLSKCTQDTGTLPKHLIFKDGYYQIK